MFQRITTYVAAATIALTAIVMGLGIGGCSPGVEKRVCMKTGTSDVLVTSAALLKLDVYGSDAHCSGSHIADGADAPLMSHTFARGATVTLDVPPGQHTLVLTTFADASGQKALGEGCAEETITPGAELCFDLALVRVGDLALGVDDMTTPPPPPDLAVADDLAFAIGPDLAQAVTGGACNPAQGLGCANGLTCCNGVCVDISSNVGNCGACNVACDQTNSFGAQCVASSCHYTSCRSGWANCTTTAPDADGCETHTAADANNCGACGRACKTAGVMTPSCSAGLCNSTCPAGTANCTEPAAPAADDGCETNTTSDANNCNGCGKKCSFANAGGSCSASACHMGSCNAGYFDCDQSATNGCEAPGYDFGGGKGCCTSYCAASAATCPPATSGKPMVAHSTGCLHATDTPTFYDCFSPVGTPGNNSTYNVQMATDAATQTLSANGVDISQATPFQDSYNAGGYTSSQMCKQIPASICICWAYSGSTTKSGGESFPAGYVDINTTDATKGTFDCYPPSPDYPASSGGPDPPWN